MDYAPGVHKMLQHLRECSHRHLMLVDLAFPPVSSFSNCACERAAVIRELAGDYGIDARTVVWKGAEYSLEEVIRQLKSSWTPTALWLHNDILADEVLPPLKGSEFTCFRICPWPDMIIAARSTTCLR